METKRGPEPGLEIILLRPEQIKTDPQFNVRPFSNLDLSKENASIDELAASLEELGQQDACVITPDHVLISGHRRRRAALIINERRSARGMSLFLLKCVVDSTGQDLRRKAIISNLHRKNLSPMDFAYLIHQVRQEHGWIKEKGWKETKKVADYFGVAEATISEHERLMQAEKEIQNRLHEGLLSMNSAKLIMRVPTAQEQRHVIARAEVIQAEDRVEKTMDAVESGTMGKKQATERIYALSRVKQRLEEPAIRKAMREVEPAETKKRKPVPLTRKELLDALARLDSDECPETGRSFIRYFLREYAQGTGQPQELQNRFCAIRPDNGKQKVG